jgi:FkbM family methyltransferase
MVPRPISYHWATEFARYWLKHTPIFSTSEIDFSIEMRPTDIVLDCGAHIGDVTSRLARTWATVYAFEPNPICYSIIEKRFRALPNVKCINAGVADRDGMATFRVPAPHEHYDDINVATAGSFVPDALEKDRYQIRTMEMRCVDLSNFITSLNKPIRFVKLDIEGLEIAVINKLIDTGCIQQIELIAAETHERQIPHLTQATNVLRERIKADRLEHKIRLDWP